jgi:predicted SAM-dependent methyltransferase
MSLRRKMTDQVSRALTWMRRRQQVSDLGDRPVKVNVGCGMEVADGWINIDGSLNALVAQLPPWAYVIAYRLSGSRAYYTQEYYCRTLSRHRFVHHDTKYGLPFANDSVDFIYSSHFLEHLTRAQAQQVLDESRRTLRPGGVVRISVPDLEEAWRMYQRGEKEAMLHDYFFVGDDAGYASHRYAYDLELLSGALQQAGFEEITRREFGKGWTPDLNLLDNRAGYTLFVEAKKPAG